MTTRPHIPRWGRKLATLAWLATLPLIIAAGTWIQPDWHGLGDSAAEAAQTRQDLSACELQHRDAKKRDRDSLIEVCMLQKGYTRVSTSVANSIARSNRERMSGDPNGQVDLRVLPYEAICEELQGEGQENLLTAIRLSHEQGFEIKQVMDLILIDMPADGDEPAVQVVVSRTPFEKRGQKIRMFTTLVGPEPQPGTLETIAQGLSLLNSAMLRVGSYVVMPLDVGETIAYKLNLPADATPDEMMTAIFVCRSYHKEALDMMDMIK